MPNNRSLTELIGNQNTNPSINDLARDNDARYLREYLPINRDSYKEYKPMSSYGEDELQQYVKQLIPMERQEPLLDYQNASPAEREMMMKELRSMMPERKPTFMENVGNQNINPPVGEQPMGRGFGQNMQKVLKLLQDPRFAAVMDQKNSRGQIRAVPNANSTGLQRKTAAQQANPIRKA